MELNNNALEELPAAQRNRIHRIHSEFTVKAE